MNSLEQKIFDITFESLKNLGFNVIIFRMTNESFTQLYFTIEKLDDTAVTASDCKLASRHIDELLHVEEIISNFTIEVSSPGVERPLFKLQDYKKYINHEIKVYLIEAVGNKKVYTGNVDSVIDNEIILTIDQKSGANITLDFVNIKKANLVFSDELFRKLIKQSKKD